MAKKKKENRTKEKRYLIEVSAKQLFALEQCCENYARMLLGQDMTLTDLFERAWDEEVRKPHNLEPTGREFWDMRREVEEHVTKLKALCWNCHRNQNLGVGHNDRADILIDMYHTFMHQRWIDMDPESKEMMRNTVMSESPMRYSTTEDLPIVTLIKEENQK